MPQLTIALKNRQLGQVVLGQQTRIGRDPEMDVVIDNVGVSRHHASVFYDGRTALVRDEGSANGVFVNGVQVSERQLLDGDVIQLGKFTLRYSVHVTAQPETQRAAQSAGQGLPTPGGPESRTARPRDAMKTFAMNPEEVRRLLGNPTAAGSGLSTLDEERDTDPGGGVDPAVKIIGGGLLLIAALGTALFFLL